MFPESGGADSLSGRELVLLRLFLRLWGCLLKILLSDEAVTQRTPCVSPG